MSVTTHDAEEPDRVLSGSECEIVQDTTVVPQEVR